MATSLYHLPVTVPPQPTQRFNSSSKFCSSKTPSFSYNNNNNRDIFCSASSSSSSTETTPVAVVEEQIQTQSSDDQLSASLPLTGCKACGRQEIENGCNGEGRIQGGIATVPGFGWWPIKAYRPCPAFVATGGRYRRTGQSMDEVVSGNSGRDTFVGKSAGAQSSKKKEKKDRSSKADV